MAATRQHPVPMSPPHDVCVAVISDLSTDARVWKEARTLRDAGYAVALIGCRYESPETVRTCREGIDVVEVPLGTREGRVSLSQRAGALLGVWREIWSTPARVYHAHNIHVLPASWATAKRRRARLVYDAHELYGAIAVGDSLKRRLVAWPSRLAEGFAVAQADAVITTNASRAIALQARHGLREIVVLANVPQLVDPVEPRNPGFPPDVPILLYQGGIYAHARPFAETIEALQRLNGVHLAIVGFGRAKEIAQIRRWAAEGGVDERVHILPQQPFDALVGSAALATVGLVPIKPVDLGHVLGDTNKLYEYLMAGLPVIASDMPEIRRVVHEGSPRVGELFDPEDPESIARAYRRVTADPEQYRRRRIEARRIALERYNWGIEEQRLRELYEGIA